VSVGESKRLWLPKLIQADDQAELEWVLGRIVWEQDGWSEMTASAQIACSHDLLRERIRRAEVTSTSLTAMEKNILMIS